MADIFISYSQEDRAWVKQLVDALIAEGYEVWWDLEIHAGESFDRAIERTLTQVGCVVAIWSRHAIDSDWVRAESGWARVKKKLVSIRIQDELELPIEFFHVHTADFSRWDGSRSSPEFRRLVADIGQMVGMPSESALESNQNELPGPPKSPESLHEKKPQEETLLCLEPEFSDTRHTGASAESGAASDVSPSRRESALPSGTKPLPREESARATKRITAAPRLFAKLLVRFVKRAAKGWSGISRGPASVLRQLLAGLIVIVAVAGLNALWEKHREAQYTSTGVDAVTKSTAKWRAHKDGTWWFYLNGEDLFVPADIIYVSLGDDLLVYVKKDQKYYLMEGYFNAWDAKLYSARLIASPNNTLWTINDDDVFWFIFKGEALSVPSDITQTVQGGDLLIYVKKTGQYFLLEDYKHTKRFQLRPAKTYIKK